MKSIETWQIRMFINDFIFAVKKPFIKFSENVIIDKVKKNFDQFGISQDEIANIIVYKNHDIVYIQFKNYHPGLGKWVSINYNTMNIERIHSPF